MSIKTFLFFHSKFVCFCLMKICCNHYKLISLSFVINETTIILTFQLNEYNQQSNVFFVNEIIDVIRHDLNFVVINKLRSAIARSSVKNTRQIFIKLFKYFTEWNINKIVLRRCIQRFNKNIVDYKVFFITIRNQSFNFNDDSSSFESIASNIQKFHSIFSKSFRQFIFSSFISQFDDFSFSSFLFSKIISSIFDFSISRIFFVIIINIETKHNNSIIVDVNNQFHNNQIFIKFTTHDSILFTWQKIDFTKQQWNSLQILVTRRFSSNRNYERERQKRERKRRKWKRKKEREKKRRKRKKRKRQKRERFVIVNITDFRWNAQKIKIFD